MDNRLLISWSVTSCLLIIVNSQQLNEGNFYNRQPASNFQRIDSTYSNGGRVYQKSYQNTAFPQNNWRQWNPTSGNQREQNTLPNNNGQKNPILAVNSWQKGASISGGIQETPLQGNGQNVPYNGQNVPSSQLYNGQRQKPYFNNNGQRPTNFFSNSYSGQSGAPLSKERMPQNYERRQRVQPLNYSRQIGATSITHDGQNPASSQNYNTRQYQTFNYNGLRGTSSSAYNAQRTPFSQNNNSRQNVQQFNNNGKIEAPSTAYNVQNAPFPQNYKTIQNVPSLNYNGQSGTSSTAYNVQRVFLPTDNNNQNLSPPLSNTDVTGSLSNYNNQKLLLTQSDNEQEKVQPSHNNAQRVPLSSNYGAKESQLFGENGQEEFLSSTSNSRKFSTSPSTSSQTSLSSSQTRKSPIISSTQRKPLDSQFLRSSLSNGDARKLSTFNNINTTPLPSNNYGKLSNTPSSSSIIPLEFHKEREV